jgi:hypothetical protein
METKEIIVGNNKAEIKSYATEKDVVALQEVTEKNRKDGKGTTLVQSAMAREMIKTMVISFNDSKEKILERMTSEISYDDYIDFITQIDQVISKKNSSQPTPSNDTPEDTATT